LDATMFQYYSQNDGIRITDLHQGIVWGTNTPQTSRDERLINRFDYDSDYGTVLNRFLMQAALGIPLTVYGTGEQTRAFIHIQDTAKCIQLALENPPAAGERPKIFNQVAETHKLISLAQLVAGESGVPVKFFPNPRREASSNELEVSNQNFRGFGFDPILLNKGLLDEVQQVALKYRSRCDKDKILPGSFWNRKCARDWEHIQA